MPLVSHFLVLIMIHGWSTYLKENFYHALAPQSFSRWISDIGVGNPFYFFFHLHSFDRKTSFSGTYCLFNHVEKCVSITIISTQISYIHVIVMSKLKRTGN